MNRCRQLFCFTELGELVKNTTVSISDNKTASNAEIKQGLSEIALKDLLGFTLFNTAELAGLFSDIMNTSQTSGPMDFALMRFIALFCGACMYIFLAHFKGRDELVRSRSCIAVACLLQLVLPSFVLLELYANLSISIVVIGFSWMLWGVAHSYLYCAWVDARSSLDDQVASKMNLWAFCATAVFVTVVLWLPGEVAAYTLIAALILSAAFLLVDASRKRKLTESCEKPVEEKSNEAEESADEASLEFEAVGSYNLVVIGIIISFSAGLLITGSFLHDFPVAFIGIAIMLSTLLFCLVKKLCPAALAFGFTLRILFPITVVSLALMTFLRGPIIEVISFILFSFLYLIDMANLSNLSMRGAILYISPALCFAKGRIYIVIGQAVGWLTVLFYYYFYSSEVWLRPFFTSALLLLMAIYIMLGAIGQLRRNMRGEGTEEIADVSGIEIASSQEADQVKHQPYKTRCLAASKQYGLTQREAEILTYLAKGRNAKYIAQQLYVAERTVKTHAYHIYQKMNIHSQQELIDIVEDLA